MTFVSYHEPCPSFLRLEVVMYGAKIICKIYKFYSDKKIYNGYQIKGIPYLYYHFGLIFIITPF